LSFEIKIDAADFAKENHLGSGDMQLLSGAIVRQLASTFQTRWKAEANLVLNQTRQEYVSSIKITHGNGKSTVFLDPDAFLPNAIEGGMASYDMKVGMLASPKAKPNGKGGKYITIPFRFAVHGSVGDRGDFAGVMPKSISDLMTGGKVGAKLGMGQIGAKHRMPKSVELRNKIKEAGLDMGGETAKLAEDDQTSKFEGLKRNAKGSGYVTFRRVSTESPAEAFIHPGFDKHDLLGKAYDGLDLDRIGQIATDNFMVGL
jgi:hypothetical protein